MPNWTDNYIEISGTPEKVEELIDAVTTVQTINDTEVDAIDLTAAKPLPKPFKEMHSGHRTIDGVAYKQWFEDDDGNVTPLLDLVKQNLLEDYGDYDPIDWQYNNWGTKWGDCDSEILDDKIMDGKRELVITFQSAWGEPFMLLNDIANKFDVTIRNTWCIELNEGEGITEYPWSQQKTESIYDTYKTQRETMKAAIAKTFSEAENG